MNLIKEIQKFLLNEFDKKGMECSYDVRLKMPHLATYYVVLQNNPGAIKAEEIDEIMKELKIDIIKINGNICFEI